MSSQPAFFRRGAARRNGCSTGGRRRGASGPERPATGSYQRKISRRRRAWRRGERNGAGAGADDREGARIERPNLGDVSEIDETAPVRAEELALELLLELGQCAVDEEPPVGGSGEHQRVVGLEPDDLFGGEQQDARPVPDAHPVRALRRRLGIRPPGERPAQLVELIDEPSGRGGVAEPLPRPLERLREPLPAHRLQQVVDRAHVERRDGIAVVGRDEDDVRDVARSLQDVEARALGHLHVEEAEIGRGLVDQPDRGFRIGGLARELEVRVCVEQLLHPLARRPLVVDDDAAVLHASVSAEPGGAGAAGRISRARAPRPPGAGDRSRAARLP